MLFTQEHNELKRTVNRIIDEDLNPYVDDWEKADIFPAHDVMKKMADAGLLGIGKPIEYGGLDLDFHMKWSSQKHWAVSALTVFQLRSVFKPLCVRQHSPTTAAKNSNKNF